MPSKLLTKIILECCSLPFVDKVFKPLTGSLGGILMLHRVQPANADDGKSSAFAPNSGLTITPNFLEALIISLKNKGYDFVDLDEATRRIKEGDTQKFVSFTLDDGYKDNAVYAAPIFEKHSVPYTIYVAPGLVDGRATLWWEDLEFIIKDNSSIEFTHQNKAFSFNCNTINEKTQAYKECLDFLSKSVSEQEQRKIMAALCKQYKFDAKTHVKNAIMTWTEIKQLCKTGLCTIGAHTIHHYAVARLSDDECELELSASRNEIEKKLAKKPAHFAYPYGFPAAANVRDFEIANKLGFTSAVTTRHGVCLKAHKTHLSALPRISINGDFQKTRYIHAMLSGATTLINNKGKRINVG
ncbi:MAG: polysaccharide deacetylase family protein [Nitratireductor sp.]